MSTGSQDRAADTVAPGAASASARPASPPAVDVAALLLATGGEAALAWMLATGHLVPAIAVALHGAVIGALALLLVHVQPANAGADRTMLALGALAAACLGPIGTLGAIAVALIAPARAATTALLKAWYARIAHSVETDPVAQLCDMVAIGRSVDLTGGPPPSFQRVMTHGTLVERQALLGLVARKFSPEYLPSLKLALTSPEPVIRVQAAAVATKVQISLRKIVHTWVARTAAGPLDAQMALAAISELNSCLSSGLIEASDRALAQKALISARSVEGVADRDQQRRLLARRDAPWQFAAISALEQHLVAERRFRDLRNWRRLKRAGLRTGIRLRASGVRRKSGRLREAAQ